MEIFNGETIVKLLQEEIKKRCEEKEMLLVIKGNRGDIYLKKLGKFRDVFVTFNRCAEYDTDHFYLEVIFKCEVHDAIIKKIPAFQTFPFGESIQVSPDCRSTYRSVYAYSVVDELPDDIVEKLLLLELEN